MNLYNIENSFNSMEEREWSTLYWFIDFHGTIAVPDYNDTSKKRQFYPYAKEVLQMLSKRLDCCVILWTCSHKDDIKDMIEWTTEHGIHFDYVNENPECPSTTRVNVEDKPYYNIMLDDRAGFEPEDWQGIKQLLVKYE